MCLQENIQPAEDEDFAVKDDSGPALGKAFAAAADQLHSISMASGERSKKGHDDDAKTKDEAG